jgi:DNA polymerase phi
MTFSSPLTFKDAPTDSEAFKNTTGHYKPQLHFAWDVLLDHLLPTTHSDTRKGTFVEFFRVVVDGVLPLNSHNLSSQTDTESLFSITSSPERKYWGFQMFEKALPRISERDLPMLFTKNFMRTWINHLSKRDRYLHKAAKQTVCYALES